MQTRGLDGGWYSGRMSVFMNRLFPLWIAVVGCRVLSGISGAVAIIMVIEPIVTNILYLENNDVSAIPFLMSISSMVLLFITGESLNALYLIAENSKSIALEISEVKQKLNTIQTLEISEVRQKLDTIQTLNQNVDAISTSISEIADRVQEVELPVG